MKRTTLPVTALPAWARLNDVSFLDVEVSGGPNSEKGYGVIAQCDLSSEDVYDRPTLMSIPNELVLSAESIGEYAREDKAFAQLKEIAGGQTLRIDIMLFLLMQITITSPEISSRSVGTSNFWTEYVKMLSSDIPLPTTWAEEEMALLQGTSLETAVPAKLASLQREFEHLQSSTSTIPWCREAWWETSSLTLREWVMLDAWFRSRSLELPHSGESMVPCLDMVNHSNHATNAYFEQDTEKVSLLLRPGMRLAKGDEVFISYGAAKSDAEMLFSYGFVEDDEQDEENGKSSQMTLSLRPMSDDPLGKAKMVAFSFSGEAPTVTLSLANSQSSVSAEANSNSSSSTQFTYHAPLLPLLILNEEDGLSFRLLQSTDDSPPSLRVFWQDTDVTERVGAFEELIADHPLVDVFRLRAVALLEEQVGEQGDRLDLTEGLIMGGEIRGGVRDAVRRLRERERRLLEGTMRGLEEQKSRLLQSESVVHYLEGMQAPEDAETDGGQVMDRSSELEEDFS